MWHVSIGNLGIPSVGKTVHATVNFVPQVCVEAKHTAALLPRRVLTVVVLQGTDFVTPLFDNP